MTEFPRDLGAFDAISPGDDAAPMRIALALGASVRTSTSPNPWVGAVVIAANGKVVGTGATAPVGGSHAEVTALQQAGDAARGGTLYVTLEPCCHVGRTPPCSDAVIASGVTRVVIGIVDPDEKVAGNGIAQLQSASIAVDVGVSSEEISDQLRPYIHHRRTARPFVLGKIAATLDGHTAAADGSSQWITGEAARCDAHRLRAESDAIVVGAGTVRADNPSLTVRHVEGRDPLRVVLGTAPKEAKIHPCLEWSSSLEELLDELGAKGCLQVLIEGGPTVLGSFHTADLIDLWAVYLAPGFMGGSPRYPLVNSTPVASISEFASGRVLDSRHLDGDVMLLVEPPHRNGVPT